MGGTGWGSPWAVGKEQLKVEESPGCRPRLQEPRLSHSIRGCGEEDHGQPRRVGGWTRADECMSNELCMNLGQRKPTEAIRKVHL